MAVKVPGDIAALVAKYGGIVEGGKKGGVWWKGGRAVATWGDMVGRVDTSPPDGS